MVRGASLICGDVNLLAIVSPADEVTEREPIKTLMRIPLDDDVFQHTYNAGTEFGILHTSLLNDTVGLFTEKEISGLDIRRAGLLLALRDPS
jgi:hypothetical protein